MGILTEDMRQLLSRERLGFVATVSSDGSPNLSPKGTTLAWDENHIIFANIKSPDTIENLKLNPLVEVNAVDPISRRGYCFSGKGVVIDEGKEFEEIRLYYYQQAGVQSIINSVVKIHVHKASPIFSPLYDLGYSEDEIKNMSKKKLLKRLKGEK